MTEPIFDHLIADMEWSVRAHNCLLNNFHVDMNGRPREGVKPLVTLGDLVQTTESELLRVPNFGRKSLNEVKQVLGCVGLHLGMTLLERRNPESLSLQDIFILLARIAESCRYLTTVEVVKTGVRLRMRKGENEWVTFFLWNQFKMLSREEAVATFKRMEDTLDA